MTGSPVLTKTIGGGCRLGCRCRWSVRRDYRDFTAYKIGSHYLEAIVPTPSPLVIHRDVLALDVTGFIESMEESGHVRCVSNCRSWTVTKRRAASRPTLRYAQSRLSRLRLMRSAAKDKRRERPAAMTTFRSPSAHVTYWRKSGNICPKKPANYPGHRSREATNP